MKKCNSCKEIKKQKDFSRSKNTKDGLHSQCKVCLYVAIKKYSLTKKGRENGKKRSKRYHEKHPEKMKESARRRCFIKYREASWKNRGLIFTKKEYEEKLKKQKGCCAICGRHESEFKKRLGIDHNHLTGQPRDILCAHCNVMVGIVEAGKVPGIIAYLEKWSKE